MRKCLEEEECPFDASLEKVLPGVLAQFQQSAQDDQRRHEEVLDQLDVPQEAVGDGLANMRDQHMEVLNESSRIIGESLVETGNSVIAQVHDQCSPKDGPDEFELPFTGTVEQAMLGLIANLTPLVTDDASLFKMQVKHPSLHSLWCKWFGLETFHDSFGGVDGRNRKFKSKWRKDAKIDNTLHGRHRRLIEAINAEAKGTKQQPQAVIMEWEVLFSNSNYVTGNLVKALQCLGKIPKKKSRGATKKP